jgi:hypothetical protein
MDGNQSLPDFIVIIVLTGPRLFSILRSHIVLVLPAGLAHVVITCALAVSR